jgi:glycosyltransferase involved in cell wall biosynthesis
MQDGVWIFPGYPPSPAFLAARERTVLYVHDLFLITRKHDLNFAARFYMRPMFRLAVATLRYFLANSQTTAAELRNYVRSDARIACYRPRIENVFGLRARTDTPTSARLNRPLRIGALGTVEPRKNFVRTAEICHTLTTILAQPVELHLIGRRGWGNDFSLLSRMPWVNLHGFLPDKRCRDVIESLDLFLCTSHAEGLGLPLLEVQHGGLIVVAPEGPVFREVLGNSALHVHTEDATAAATAIADLVGQAHWRERGRELALANVARWNEGADSDRAEVIAFLSRLAERSTPGRG